MASNLTHAGLRSNRSGGLNHGDAALYAQTIPNQGGLSWLRILSPSQI